MALLGPTSRQDPPPVLLSPDAPPGNLQIGDYVQYRIGGQICDFRVQGIISEFPTLASPFMVVSLYALEEQIEVDDIFQSQAGWRELWLRTDPAQHGDVVATVKEMKVDLIDAAVFKSGRIAGDVEAQLSAFRVDLVARITVAAFALNAIILTALSSISFAVLQVFAARSRTVEFGVLRAVGWRPSQVLALVLGESLVLSLLGGLAGTLLGIAAVRAVQNVPTAGAFLTGSFSWPRFIQGMGVALALGLAGGALPAWRASRLLPVEAMRSEGGTVHVPRHVRWGALRNVLRQPMRTLLTVVAIGIAMMSIVLLGAMGDGMVDMFSGLAGGLDAHLVGSETDASVDLSKIDEGAVRRIAALPGVETAEGFLTGYTSLGDLPFFVVFGYQPRGALVRGRVLLCRHAHPAHRGNSPGVQHEPDDGGQHQCVDDHEDLIHQIPVRVVSERHQMADHVQAGFVHGAHPGAAGLDIGDAELFQLLHGFANRASVGLETGGEIALGGQTFAHAILAGENVPGQVFCDFVMFAHGLDSFLIRPLCSDQFVVQTNLFRPIWSDQFGRSILAS